MNPAFQQSGRGNVVRTGAHVELSGMVVGNNNRIEVADAESATSPARLRVQIHGDGNRIVIDANTVLKGLLVSCGNHVPAHDTALRIGANTTVEAGGRFFLYNSGNVLQIGSHCMLSNNITVRCGESPHLLFDKDTGAYLDVSDGVFIGDHVWVGEGVSVLKSARIGDDCVVGAHSVVTRRFDGVSHAAIAGNPARVVRQGVQWVRNPGMLEPGSAYEAAYRARQAGFPRRVASTAGAGSAGDVSGAGVADAASAGPLAAPAPLRLQLGGGAVRVPGHRHVDIDTTATAAGSDATVDGGSGPHGLRAVADDSVDALLALQAIERLPQRDAAAAVAEWLRVLKPGGTLAIETPNLLSACAEVLRDPGNAADAGGQHGIQCLYGDPRQGDARAGHRWLYTPQTLAQLLHDAGFRQLRQTPPQHGLPHPHGMRVEATKPALG